MNDHSPQVPVRWHGNVLAWRKGRQYPRRIEFLVSDRIEDPNPPRVGETLVDRHKRLCDDGARRKRRFPGGHLLVEDETSVVSPKAFEIFTCLGLPGAMPATLKRVFAVQTGFTLVNARPRPIHGWTDLKRTSGTEYRFFMTGPNDDGMDWSGIANTGLVLWNRPGELDEIVEPPLWVVYEDLLDHNLSYSNRSALHKALKEIFRREDEWFGDSDKLPKPVLQEQPVGNTP